MVDDPGPGLWPLTPPLECEEWMKPQRVIRTRSSPGPSGCTSDPCTHGGICRDTSSGGFLCVCPTEPVAYVGTICEKLYDACSEQVCPENQTCHATPGALNHTCHCPPGFGGPNCSSIDCGENGCLPSCTDQPCHHGGTCLASGASFACLCPPGWAGPLCEEDVDECMSGPCQNGALCVDGPGGFLCYCVPGFQGPHCELDINECASRPCKHGASCINRVDGYQCLCSPGYTDGVWVWVRCGGRDGRVKGSMISLHSSSAPGEQLLWLSAALTWLDPQPNAFPRHSPHLPGPHDCKGGEMTPSLPGAVLGGLLLLTGISCMVNVDDCASEPCFHGASCEDGVNDYMCHCPPTWGGKDCSVLLTGCEGHACQHGAQCIPIYKAGAHSYTCHCLPGFHGPRCAQSTTFSLATGGSLLVALPASDGHGQPAVSLRFRTTLPDGLLFSRGDTVESLTLVLSQGTLWTILRSQGTELPLNLNSPSLSDGHWHRAEVVLLQSALELRLWHEACENGPCLKSHPLVGEVALDSPAFLTVRVGGGAGTSPSFVGCLEDVRVDGHMLVPQDLADGRPGVRLGCERTDWCGSGPCDHGGSCVDLWTTFHCDCPRPYEGPTCSEEPLAWTFGLGGSHSRASFQLRDAPGPNLTLSFVLRTREASGFLLQMTNGSLSNYTVFLARGEIHVETTSTSVVTYPGRVDDGHRHLVTLSLGSGQLQGLPLGPSYEVHVGGLALPAWAEPWGGNFKGCLQDIRLNSLRLDFLPLLHPGNWTGSGEVYEGEASNLTLGCVSEDTCILEPCHNGGTCTVTWNDFICVCPPNFTGPTCAERLWCQDQPCPPPTTCVEVPNGYICLANATFQDQPPAVFTGYNLSAKAGFAGLSLAFRTRDPEAVLLQAAGEGASLWVAIRNNSLSVAIRSGNSIEGATFRGAGPVSDGAWHWVTLTMEEPGASASRWWLQLDGARNTTLWGQAGSLDFLRNRVPVVLAENFTGCLGRVSIGGLDLPFVRLTTPLPQPEQFLLASRDDIDLGCRGGPVCSVEPCLHGGTCQDLFNDFSCSCGAGWEGPRCEVDVDECGSAPCVHGHCGNLPGSYRCHCSPGYTGRDCETDVDDCLQHACLHGATCVDEVLGYSCRCPPDFSGPRCQWPFPPDECGQNFTCLNGGRCYDGPWGANCTCPMGYTGLRCHIPIPECEPNPCQNGGTCQAAGSEVECICTSSFGGRRCDVAKGPPTILFPFPLIEVVVPVACGCLLLLLIGLLSGVLAARKRRQSEGTYSPSQQEVAGARLEMDSVLKVPPEERLI
ncbi:protein crumbs homolog 2 [Gracilinanus agilis]|uniref:protein crumbs homolog 2 n=1 Tax=Gracilinanus agilis TaxID=191870 RepID=UPI001CFCAAAA|nr:protein crumbs homolog 2 [Gracilinanus agilis]